MAKDSVSQIKKLQAEAQVLLDDRGMAGVDEAQLHPFKKFAHFWILVGKSFARNRCPVRASALAYATLLALIPMLAVVASITSSFLKKQGEDQIDRFIVKMVSTVAGSSAGTTNSTAISTNTAALTG